MQTVPAAAGSIPKLWIARSSSLGDKHAGVAHLATRLANHDLRGPSTNLRSGRRVRQQSLGEVAHRCFHSATMPAMLLMNRESGSMLAVQNTKKKGRRLPRNANRAAFSVDAVAAAFKNSKSRGCE